MRLNHPNIFVFFTLLTTILLQGCERTTPEAILENYQDRISNVLKIDQPNNYNLPTRPLFPLRRLRIMETSEIREGLLDVLKLKECGLLPLIAERNSSLGKVYQPSQKMRYELRFFHAIRECKNRILVEQPTNRELQSHINEILQAKQKNLAAELWNGVYTSKEIEDNFARDKIPLPLQRSANVLASINAMTQLTVIVRTPLEKEQWALPEGLDKIESIYEVLFVNQSGPKILTSLQLLTLHLNQASNTLNQGMHEQKLCTNNLVSNNAKIMKNIFYKFYIGEVQPYLAHIHKSAEAWLDINNNLINSFKEYNILLPRELESYQRMVLSKTDDQSIWQQYIAARNKHTMAWQTLLKQCGMMPAGQN